MSRPEHNGDNPGDVVFKDGKVWIWTGSIWMPGDSVENKRDPYGLERREVRSKEAD